MVAKAAPKIPHWKIKMKIGSRMVFTMAPITIQVIEYLGLPSARIKLLKPVVTIPSTFHLFSTISYKCTLGFSQNQTQRESESTYKTKTCIFPFFTQIPWYHSCSFSPLYTLLTQCSTCKMSLDEIADCVPSLSLDELKELEAKVMQLA